MLSDGWAASKKATALAAMMCSSGPPWMPGNTFESTAFACCCLQRMSPERGPRSVLWVVVVTASADCPDTYGYTDFVIGAFASCRMRTAVRFRVSRSM